MNATPVDPTDVMALVREDLRELGGYVPAAPDFSRLRLHANENPWDEAGATAAPADASPADRNAPHGDAGATGAAAAPGLNHYPPARATVLEARLAAVYDVPPERLLITRGSDDGIDLLVRAFCRAGRDAVLVTPPTFGMYAHAARVQNAACVCVPLRREAGWALAPDAVLAAIEAHPEVRLLFLCSPNNPTGNRLAPDRVLSLAATLAGRAAVVVDEAYVEFTGERGFVDYAGAAAGHANLIVLRTLSKAYGLAGARCGAVIADPALVGLLASLAPPYCTPSPVIRDVLAGLTPPALARRREQLDVLAAERTRLAQRLAALPFVRHVWPSDANFLLAEVDDAQAVVRACHDRGVLVRAFGDKPELGQAVRVTVGSPAQVDRLLAVLEQHA